MTRALVTGIAGQDGSLLAELLVAEGCEVVGLARDLSAPMPNLAAVRDRVSLVEGDLRDHEALRALVRDVAPDELYHLGAPTFVPASFEDPVGTMEAIAGATRAVLEALPSGSRAFVATSSEIFGDAGVVPQHEGSPMRPRNPYGEAKLAAHRLVGEARGAGRFAVSGITYNHESVRRPERFVTRRVSLGVARLKLGLADEVVLGDLDAVRDWSAAVDVVRGAVLAVRHSEPEDYVLASGVGRTVRELVRVAFAYAGLEVDGHVRVDPAFVRGVEPTPLIGDPSRARRVLGWEPQVSFEELVGSMIDADVELLSG